MDDPGGRVTDGSAARGRTTNRPVFLSPGKLYLVYMGLSRKEDIRRGFRRLRAASDFALGGKVTKTPLGTAPLIKGRCRAQRDRGDRDLPLPPYIGNLSSSVGRPVSGPYEKRAASGDAVGAAHRAARERPDEGIGPHEKNATTPVSAVSLRTT